MNGNDYIIKDGGILLIQPQSFSLTETFECGQCFRAYKIENDKYCVVAYEKMLTVTKTGGDIFLHPATLEDFETIWIPYFDLSRDYNEIKETLAADDFVMRDAVEYAPGIRILRQEFFECLISYIISQNSSIPMIKQVIKNISQTFGNEVGDLNDQKYYSFPTLEALSAASIEELRACKTGFRDKYIADACRMIKSGDISEDELNSCKTHEIRERLMRIKGVGQKVADCVILFSFGRFESFPIDVWVKRIMQHFYFSGEDTPVKAIHELAAMKYGVYSGFAQEYLFYFARQFQIGK